MKLLALYGSPRKGGNSDDLLDGFLEGTRDCGIERIYLRDLHIAPCSECAGCSKTGMCVVRDDMQLLYPMLLEYDRVVMSFPVYFLGPPALTKGFIDRGQALWIRKYVLGIKPEREGIERKGFLLSVGGFKGTDRIFRCNIVVARAFYATCGLSHAGEVLESGIEGPGDARNSADLMRRAREAGGRFSASE